MLLGLKLKIDTLLLIGYITFMIQRERDSRAAEAARIADARAQELARIAQEAEPVRQAREAARQAQEAKDLATFNANRTFLESLKVPDYLQAIIQEEGLQNACVAWSDGLLSQKVNRVEMQLAGVALLQVSDYRPGYYSSPSPSDYDSGGWVPAELRGRKVEFLGNAEHEALIAPPNHIEYKTLLKPVSRDVLADPSKMQSFIANLFLDNPGSWDAEPCKSRYGSTIRHLVDNVERGRELRSSQKRGRFWQRLFGSE